jgi:uncharacterized surface protein with fasciclin (FAS1) repeats
MKKTIRQIAKIASRFLFVAALMFGCTEDPELWNPRSTEQVITQYVATQEDFSQFAEILESTGLNSLLSVRGPFTLFLPTNAALQAYYTSKNVQSHAGFTNEEKNDLVMNHLIPMKIESGDIGLGAIREVNGIGDFLVTEFEGADIILNKESKIIKRDVQTANGVIHIIDKVIDPVSKSVFEVLEDNPSFSLFTEGLRITNIKDTLQLIEFPYGQRMARTRFTILAVADTTFNRYGIHTINDLINYFTNAPDSITYMTNGFYRYMEYHCLAETHFLNNFENRLYPILSYDNNISATVDTEDYKLNLVPSTGEYTGFIIDQSNFPAKNGAVHTVNDLLPVYEPRPSTIVWETTDHFDIKQGDYFGKHYMRWHDGQNTFKNIKWEGDYMLYYFKDHNTGKLMNHDCLSMSGWWWVEVTTPKIMKGKYRLTSNLWGGQIDYAVYVDGVNTAYIKSSDPAETTSWGEFEWTTTSEHTIKVVAKTPGLLFWDTLIFTPIP